MNSIISAIDTKDAPKRDSRNDIRREASKDTSKDASKRDLAGMLKHESSLSTDYSYSSSAPIAKGGFGEVWAGRRRRDDRPVAMKILRKKTIPKWTSWKGDDDTATATDSASTSAATTATATTVTVTTTSNGKRDEIGVKLGDNLCRCSFFLK